MERLNEMDPCPFCGAGETFIRENRMSNAPRMDGKQSPLISVEINHWCPAKPGQPIRNTITRVGRDWPSALAAWNRRAPGMGFREGAEVMREEAAREVDCGCDCRAAVLAATTSIDRTYACGREPCAAAQAADIRAIPIPAPPKREE